MITSVSNFKIMRTWNFIRFWSSSNDRQKLFVICLAGYFVSRTRRYQIIGVKIIIFSFLSSRLEMTHTSCCVFDFFRHFSSELFDCWTSQFDCVCEECNKSQMEMSDHYDAINILSPRNVNLKDCNKKFGRGQ